MILCRDASKEEKNKPKETGSSRNMQEKEKVPQNQLFGIIDGWTLIIFSPFFIPGESHHLVAEGWVQELRLRIDPMSHGARRTVQRRPLHRKWNASIRRHHMGLMWMCQNRNLPKKIGWEGQLRWTFLFCLWFVRELRVVIVSWHYLWFSRLKNAELRGRSGRTRGARNHRVDSLWAWKRSFNHRRSLVIFSISTDMTWGLGVAQIL